MDGEKKEKKTTTTTTKKDPIWNKEEAKNLHIFFFSCKFFIYFILGFY